MIKKHIQTAFEIKEMDDSTGKFSGYGSVFGNVDSHGDVIVKGAFLKSLQERPIAQVKMLWQHNTEMPVGVWEVGAEDERGLYLEGELLINEVPIAKQAYALLKRKAISGLSIGFRYERENTTIENGITFLKEIDLWEVSLVTFPSNQQANVTEVKSIKDIQSVKEFEVYLREAGVSRSQAKALAIRASKGIMGQCEADDEAEVMMAIKKLSQSIKSEV